MKVFLYRFIHEDQKNFFAKALKGFLWILSFVYVGLSKIAFWLHQHHILKKNILPKPVISIGNLTLGGTGKTPLAGFIVSYLKHKGHEPAILIRGYMAQRGVSDEVELYKEMLPHIPVEQGRNRFEAGIRVLKNYPSVDTFVLDDGFQHWALDRDLDVVSVDATNPFGNGFCLPRGTLREPLSALKRADVIVLTKVDLAKENLLQVYTVLRRNNFHAIFVEAVYEPVKLINLKEVGQDQEVSSLKGVEVALFSAIGNSQAFEKTVLALGAYPKKTFSFLDHHAYTKKDLQHMMKEVRAQNITTFITTQKDAVKLRGLTDLFPNDVKIFALAISMKIVKGEKELEERIDSILRR